MKRNKKIILLSHCILNQNSVVKLLARAKGAYNMVIEKIIRSNIGIIQLPCPEFLFLGENRLPKTKEEYDNRDYRILCENLIRNIQKQIIEYMKNGYKIIGIIGIEESPSCGLVKNQGIFMEVLLASLDNLNINIPKLEIPTSYHEERANEFFLSNLDKFLNIK
ncbi:MAG: hypothetical protein MJA82_13055 [Clostridia bacterium]|nr:hypothetical protein [Clostridia bacterium]